MNKNRCRGAMLIEYGMVLAFVIVVGIFFLSDGSLAGSINSIFNNSSDVLAQAVNQDKAADKADENLIAGKVQNLFRKNISANGMLTDQSENSLKDYAHQTSIVGTDDKPFALSMDSVYEFTIDPTKFGDESKDYRFTLKLFADTETGYKNILDDGGFNIHKKELDKWEQEKFDPIRSSSEYGYNVERRSNEDNTITYTITTGSSNISVAGQVFNTNASTHRQNIDEEKVADFANSVSLKKVN